MSRKTAIFQTLNDNLHIEISVLYLCFSSIRLELSQKNEGLIYGTKLLTHYPQLAVKQKRETLIIVVKCCVLHTVPPVDMCSPCCRCLRRFKTTDH